MRITHYEISPAIASNKDWIVFALIDNTLIPLTVVATEGAAEAYINQHIVEEEAIRVHNLTEPRVYP